MAGLKAHYAAHDIEGRIVAAIRAAGLDPDGPLSPEALGALDHFHTGGIDASRELLDLLPIGAADRVLDIGAGLAGPARLIASARGCRVDCIDLSLDYCVGATLLNRMTGLAGLVAVHQGSALAMPFPDGTFSAVWMQNVGMNIADKRGLYAEIRRVLKPGGRFAFQEMVAGTAPVSAFPLPWAIDPADSFLVPAEAMCALLGEAGFVALHFEDTSSAHLGRSGAPAAPGALSLAAFVDDLGQKARNARRSLQDGEIRLVRGVFRAT